jgi:signal transduction histidine kinase
MHFQNVATVVDEELTPLLDRPEELNQKLERFQRGFNIDVAIFDARGELLSNAGDALVALDEAPAQVRWIRKGVAIPINGGRAYVVAKWEGQGLRWVLVPLVVLFVLALVTIPLARSIVRPIERITLAARAVGEGQLDARTGVKRRDEVGVLARAFDDMATRLERLVAGEKELRANVSHELRTPLARIRVALEIAEEGSQDPEKIQKHLRGIRGDIIELEELVDQVLITARLDLANEDEVALRRSATDLAALAQSSAARFREIHPDHELEVELDESADVTVTADPKLIKRVIDNLLENSAKYADAADGPITLEVRHASGSASVSLSDRGLGVAPEELARLFEPFFRADSVRAQNTKGVGLGLSFCRRVVEAHDGVITAERRDGGGLTVKFMLPA